MKSRNAPRRAITRRLWFSFGLLIFLLILSAFIYNWKVRQVSSDIVQLVDVQEPLQRVVLEMQISASDIGWAVSDYIRNRDPVDVERVRNAEVNFEGAVAEFNELAQTSEAKELSQEIARLHGEFKGIAYQVITLVDQQHTTLTMFREDVNGIGDLIDSSFRATIDGVAPDAVDKLMAMFKMQSSLDIISGAVENYIIEPDPNLLQDSLDAQANFNQFVVMYRETSLSAYEDSWLDHINNHFEESRSDSAKIFTITDNLQELLGQFEQSLAEVDAYINEQVQPFVFIQSIETSIDVQDSTNSASRALVIMSVIGVVIGSIVVLLMSRKITRPIRDFVSGAKMIAGGKFEYRFDIDSGGEFTQLAYGLNQMLDNLGRSREALGESEEMAWALLDSTNDAVILTDVRGTILASNEVAAERFGMGLEQMIDMSLFDLYPADAADALRRNLADVVSSKKLIHSEYEREGKIIDQNIYPISDGKGEISRVAIFARDITVRKWVEEVTEQLGRRNELILEAAGEGIYGLDTQGKTTFVNPAAARMLGYKPDDLIGQRHHELVHHSKPDGKLYPPEHCPIYATFKDGIVHKSVDDEVFWRKDGTSFPIEYTSTPVIEKGKIIGAVVTFQDITERKRIEKALRQSEENYRLMFEAASSLIISVNKEGIIIDCNNRVQQVLGYVSGEIIGQNLIKYVNPDEHTRISECLNEVFTKGFQYNNEYRMIRKDGITIGVRMNAAAVRDANGEYIRTICMIDDITGQYQTQQV